MKFISKSSNLLIVLRPGLQAQPLTGTPAVPTISVRFKDGVAEVPDGDLCNMMLAHAGFNSDFISGEVNGGIDPFASSRQSLEPAHVLTELKFGTPMSRKIEGGSGAAGLPPELRKIIQDAAVGLAKEMLPGLVEGTLRELVKGHTAAAPAKAKGKPGRKPGSGKKSLGQTVVSTTSDASTTTVAANPLQQTDAS